jgi:PEP-CTERM motif-containing protein
MKILFGLCLVAGLASATPTFPVLTFNGDISGMPGNTVGWSFSLEWDSPDQWLSVTESALQGESNPSLGIYTDFIGPQGGPLPDFAIAPSTTWSQTFDPVLQTGIGSYTIDPSTPLFATDTGEITIFYDLYDASPIDGGNLVSSGSISAEFSVTAADEAQTPEPGSWVLAAIGLALIGLNVFFAKRKRISAPYFSE